MEAGASQLLAAADGVYQVIIAFMADASTMRDNVLMELTCICGF